MLRPPDLLKEEAALLVEHEALLVDHERLTAGCYPSTAWRAHAHNLMRHRRRLRSFMEALQMWRNARRAV